MAREHNFSAGPAVLPEPVLREAQEALWNLKASGLGLLECSHRSPLFEDIIDRARTRLRSLMRLADDQDVLFLQGGAQSQFYMLPMNLLRGGRAAYIDTDIWSAKAEDEARRFGTIAQIWSSRDSRYNRVPRQGEWGELPDDTVYLHYTSNNTVAGTQFHYIPEADCAVTCDASSDIVSTQLEGSKFDLLYAGAQKNLGPSGVVVVVIRKGLLERCDAELPTMLRYGVHQAKGSMYNTPNTFGIYVLERVCAWIEDQGGLAVIEARNRAQANRIYQTIDASDFYAGRATTESRSLMNLTFSTGDDERDTRFWKEAAKVGLSGLKGHRSVGGLRASIYNAQTDAAVDALVDYMRNFERVNG